MDKVSDILTSSIRKLKQPWADYMSIRGNYFDIQHNNLSSKIEVLFISPRTSMLDIQTNLNILGNFFEVVEVKNATPTKFYEILKYV